MEKVSCEKELGGNGGFQGPLLLLGTQLITLLILLGTGEIFLEAALSTGVGRGRLLKVLLWLELN